MDTAENKIINCHRGYTAKQNAQQEYIYTPQEGCCKLRIFDWLRDIPTDRGYDIFEVRLKNTHKGFYRNVNGLGLEKGDIIAVESATGHDIGIISCCGPLVELQLRRSRIKSENYEFKKIYRKAKPVDIEKWQEAIAREHTVMIRSRQIAARLKLNMKIGDVEFQGDGTKAIFYYIADERVDFRELIKIFADEFRIRIEMRQIGARQEAGLIGGIGVCGRELCCAQWISEFMSVNTNAARVQELSLNPQKLAGQCSKLKCCINYEVSVYVDAQKDFPQIKHPLETIDGTAYWQKTDVLKRLMWFSFDPHVPVNLTAVPVERVKEIIELNRQGKKVDYLVDENSIVALPSTDFISSAGEDSITRFDKTEKKHKRQHHKGHHKNHEQRGLKPKTDETTKEEQPKNPKERQSAPSAQGQQQERAQEGHHGHQRRHHHHRRHNKGENKNNNTTKGNNDAKA